MLLLALLAPAAWADVPTAGYERLNRDLIRHHVLPRYQTLASAAEALDDDARAFCRAPEPGALDDDYLGRVDVQDGCGVAPDGEPGGFLISSGRGGVVRWNARDGSRRPLASALLGEGHGDNHLVSVAGSSGG